MLQNIYKSIGNTPLVKINNIDTNIKRANIYAKVEFLNPSGSIKDRASLYMIEAAEKEGILKKGSTIIEPTSGNTGIALAMIGAAKSYKVILVMPESMSIERINLMKSYGAKVILTKSKDGMKGSVDLAYELSQKYGYFLPNQFKNINNLLAHYYTTGLEIIDQTDGKIDAFVAGVGTGGTVSGIGRKLKEFNKNIIIAGVQPKSSPVLTKNIASSHSIQGIGANFIPDIYDDKIVDMIIDVEDNSAFEYSRLLAKKEGLLSGISAGANLKASIELAIELGEGKNIITVLPDSGERYLSTNLFNYGDIDD